jgi:hypothetical protein
MIKSLISFLFLFTVIISFGQKIIDNKLSETHIAVKGTKISLIPPEDFTKATNFNGFEEEESSSSIMVLDLPGSYAEISGSLTKANFAKQGVEAEKIEELIVNGLPALLITGQQLAYGEVFGKYILVFGTEKETIIINGAFPKEFEELGPEIKKAMLSIYYEREKILDPFENLDFSVDPKGTKLKFAGNVSGSLLFTVDAQIPTLSDDKTNLIVAKSISAINPDDKKAFAINRFKQTPLTVEKIEYTQEISIDDLPGYEILAEGKDNKTGEIQSIYQVILFTDTVYYMLLGTSNDKSETSIADIKKVIMSFRRK